MSSTNAGNNPARLSLVSNIGLSDSVHPQRGENVMPNGVPTNRRADAARESSSARGNSRRLRVEDALCYLDQVKQQFADAPDVYINFLDVMKDFKSQAIDTPGVIKRVSRLFRGRPSLIIAFNTFLPPGFEVSIDAGRVIITEPNGHHQVVDEYLAEHSAPGLSQEASTATPPAVQPLASTTGTPSHPPPPASSSTTRADQVVAPIQRMTIEQQPEVEVLPPVTDSSQSSETGPTSSLSTRVGIAKYQHAILYKNKVMARFEKRPEVYHKFLEILQQFYRMTQDGTAVQAYKQAMEAVEALFENETDLIQEFKQQFQPKSSGTGKARALPGRQETAADLVGKRKAQKSGDRSALVVSPQPVCVPKVISPPKRSTSMHSTAAPKRMKLGVTNVLTYDTNLDEAIKFGTVGDLLFFDKIRKALVDENVYENYVRCIGLYNQSIISKNELLELSTPFIGRFAELMKHLKELLGMSDTHNDIQQQNEEKQRRQQLNDDEDSDWEHKIDFATSRRLGVSYRSLPDSYGKPLCSGRTPLCDSVLNDYWVSFPSWSSEDSTCGNSKKTTFEEFVFRTEEERFELDIIIEVNKSALEVLEMVQRKMSRMKKDELNRFRLDPALGGTSPSIMARALKRIYGDHTQKMLEGAMKNPQIMVPRLIERMRQKDFEWRKNQEICNRIWREETEKHYSKSLDHQALIFKQNDMKLLKARTIVNQFESLYDVRTDSNDMGEALEYGPHCIYTYPEDMSVLYDVNDLVIHYVKRQANIQKEEKRQAKRYLKRFIPELFNVPPQELSDEEETEERGIAAGRKELSDDDRQSGPSHGNGDDQKKASGDNKDGMSNVSGPSRGNGDDQKKASSDDKTVTSNVSGPSRRNGDDQTKASSDDKTGTSNDESENDEERKKSCTYRLFYGANTWCIFIRLHHLMCDRLAYLKKVHREIVENYKIEERIRSEREKVISQCAGNNSLLKSIEMDTKLGLPLLKPGNESPDNYYTALINEIKNLLDGIIDSVAFEDSVRKMFGTSAYLTFTMDKIIITIARQLQNMSCEDANIASMNLYKKYRFENPIGLYSRGQNEENIDDAYERAAQEVLANQNCFKTYFLHDSRSVTMELIDTEVTEEADRGESDQEWSQYVHHYIEGLAAEPSSSNLTAEDQQHFLESISERPPLFLMKNIKAGTERYRKNGDGNSGDSKQDEKWSDVLVNEDLHMYFSPPGNYKMRLAKGSSDLLIRTGAPRRGITKHKATTARRKARFLAWLAERLSEEGGDVLGPRNWLAEGSRIVPLRHPEYPYITYNRYYPAMSSTSSTSSSNRS